MEEFGPSYQEAVDDYLLTLRAAGRSTYTIDGRRRLLGRFGRHCGNRLAVDPSEVEGFLVQQRASRNSLAQYAISLKRFFAHCVAQGWLSGNPVAGLPRMTYRPLPVHPATMDEIRRALEAATQRQHDIIVVLLSTGLRLQELASIRDANVDWQRRTVRVQRRGVSARTAAFDDTAAPALRRLLRKRLTYGIISEELRKIQRKAQLPGFTASRLRHTFAFELLEQGARLDVVQRLLGLRSLQATGIYLRGQNQEETLEARSWYDPLAIALPSSRSSGLRGSTTRRGSRWQRREPMSSLIGVQERLRERLDPEMADTLYGALDRAVGDWLCDIEGICQDIAYRHGLNESESLWVMGLIRASLYGGNTAVKGGEAGENEAVESI